MKSWRVAVIAESAGFVALLACQVKLVGVCWLVTVRVAVPVAV